MPWAVTGALIFAGPLIYAMEMRSSGAWLPIWKVLVLLGVELLINLGLAYYAGFTENSTPRGVVDRAIEVVVIRVVVRGLLLLILQRIAPVDAPARLRRSIALQAISLNIGTSIANSIFAA